MINFSVIIPTYNNLPLLKKAIASVIYQKDITYEIIVVDDSTSNEIRNFVTGLAQDNLKYFKNIPKKGAVKNWNYGLSLAQGTYVTVLHHDESYVDQEYHLKKTLSFLRNGNDIIISKVQVQKSSGLIYYLRFPEVLKESVLTFFPSILFFFNFIGPVSCVTFNKKIIQKFDPQLKWLVDIEWYYRLFAKSRITYIKNLQVLSILDHKEKITDNINISKELKKDIKIIRKKYGLFSSLYLLSKIKQLMEHILPSAPKKIIRS